jgi:hypothetical protein
LQPGPPNLPCIQPAFMAIEDLSPVEVARTAPRESIPALLGSASGEVLDALIENPALDETHVCLLLERKDLSGSLLEKIAKRKTWRASYRVRRALAAHPHTPRLLGMRLLRDLHLMDLVRISLLPVFTGELRRLAEERILAQLPQLPLGQRLMLAKRASSRVAGGLITQGPEQVARAALDNAFLTESHLLKTLAKEALPARTVAAAARHRKWSKLMNVRVALLGHSHVPAECLAELAAGLPRREVEELLARSRLPASVRAALRQELAQREKE